MLPENNAGLALTSTFLSCSLPSTREAISFSCRPPPALQRGHAPEVLLCTFKPETAGAEDPTSHASGAQTPAGQGPTCTTICPASPTRPCPLAIPCLGREHLGAPPAAWRLAAHQCGPFPGDPDGHRHPCHHFRSGECDQWYKRDDAGHATPWQVRQTQLHTWCSADCHMPCTQLVPHVLVAAPCPGVNTLEQAPYRAGVCMGSPLDTSLPLLEQLALLAGVLLLFCVLLLFW